ASGSRSSYTFFVKRRPAGLVVNFIGTGFRAGLAMTGGSAEAPATTELGSALLFGNFDPNVHADTNIAYPAGTEPLDEHDDIPLVDRFKQPAGNNGTSDPGLESCFDRATLRAAPAAALTASAAAPPDDGFFDPGAAYIGAFRDRSDGWASGNWLVWNGL